MKAFKNILLLLIVILVTFLGVYAGEPGNESVEMADTMRSNGKIYVLVAIIVTILAGLLVYLWSLDRKISKLEQTAEDHR